MSAPKGHLEHFLKDKLIPEARGDLAFAEENYNKLSCLPESDGVGDEEIDKWYKLQLKMRRDFVKINKKRLSIYIYCHNRDEVNFITSYNKWLEMENKLLLDISSSSEKGSEEIVEKYRNEFQQRQESYKCISLVQFGNNLE